MALAQGPTADAPTLLSWSRQVAVREDWLEKRHGSLLALMRKHGIAMWVLVNEEFHDDPLTHYVAPPRPFASHHCKLADMLAACETFVHAAETKALKVVIER